MSLVVRNLLFTVVVPGLGAGWAPWSILARYGHGVTPVVWAALPVIVAGALLYGWCVWNFATVGRGTPGPVGRPVTGRRRRAVPVGAESDLHRCPAGRAGGGRAVPVAAAAGLRGCDGRLFSPVRARLRGAHPPAALRPLVRGVPAGGTPLAAAPACRLSATGPDDGVHSGHSGPTGRQVVVDASTRRSWVALVLRAVV